jgi:hypothetical protein
VQETHTENVSCCSCTHTHTRTHTRYAPPRRISCRLAGRRFPPAVRCVMRVPAPRGVAYRRVSSLPSTAHAQQHCNPTPTPKCPRRAAATADDRERTGGAGLA